MTIRRKKVIIKFFLFQIIVMWGGYNFSYACANQVGIQATYIKSHGRSQQHYAFCTVHNGHEPIIKPDSAGSEKENSESEVLDAEYEEDELFSFRRYSESGNYFTASSSSLVPKYFHHDVKESLPSPDHSFHFLSYKSFLFYQVFRL